MNSRTLFLAAWLAVCSVLGGAAATAVAEDAAQKEAPKVSF